MRSVIVIMIVSAICAGCAIGPTSFKRFISPAQADYDQASSYFEQRDYAAAIAAYEKFVEDYPRHDLTPGAYLGLAWSYYLTGEYEQSLQAQNKVKTKDKKLKAWLEKLASNCKTKLATTAAASGPRLFNIPEFTNQAALKVEGTVPEGSTVSVDTIQVPLQGTLFSQEIPLEEGNNVIKIVITNQDGQSQESEFNVVLDSQAPQLELINAQLNDFGYVDVSGLAEVGAIVTANDEELSVSPKGEFSGEIKLPRNQRIELVATDRAGNTTETTFSDTEEPERPTNLRLRDLSTGTADLEWDENSEEDIYAYDVYYSLAGEFSDQKFNREIIKDTIYTMTGLQSGQTYTVHIRAIDKMGNESEPSWETLQVAVP